MSSDDFYVGWAAGASRPARFALRLGLALVALLALAAVLLALLQSPFDPGIFEFGEERTLRGRLFVDPEPRIVLDAPLAVVDVRPTPYHELLLVDRGKHGAVPRLGGLDGSRVEARGSLIAAPEGAMLELAAAPVELTETAGGGDDALVDGRKGTESAATVALVGEIADSKCRLGVMKPGRGKAHRSCAALCLQGGIPPILLVHGGEAGGAAAVLLVGSDGSRLGPALAPWVGRPVRVRGRLESVPEGLARLHVDPRAIEEAAP